MTLFTTAPLPAIPVLCELQRLDEKVKEFNQCHFPGFKAKTRDISKKVINSVESFPEKEIQNAYVIHSNEFQEVLSIKNRIQELYDSIQGTTKTKNSLSSVLLQLNRFETKKAELENFLESCKDPNVEILFKSLIIEDVEKPDLSALQAEAKVKRILQWFVKHSDALANQITSLTIPPTPFITHLPIAVFKFLPGLVELNCSGHRLKILPAELSSCCPHLQTLKVSGNFLVEVPASLAHLVNLNEQKQIDRIVYDNNATEFLSHLKVGALQKPDFSHDSTLEYRAEALLNWLVENKIALSCVNIVIIPEGSSIDEIPLGVLQYLPGLVHLELPHARLTQLPDNLLSICPDLKVLNVKGNYLMEVPPSLTHLVDLSKQRQKQRQTIPMVYDENAHAVLSCIPLENKPQISATDEEKTTWLIQNRLALETIDSLEIPFHFAITELPLCILQHLPGLTKIQCLNGALKTLPENLLAVCLKLTELNVAGNLLETVPSMLKEIVDLSIQKQRIPMVYDENAHALLRCIPRENKPQIAATDEEKTRWFVQNKSDLETIDSLEIPYDLALTKLSLCILQYLPGLIKIQCLNGRLEILPDNLLAICPKLTGLDVAGNFIESVPASLRKIVDLSKQKQRIPLVFDADVDILFHAVRLLLGEEGELNSVDEKASWLITHQDKLAKEIKILTLPPNTQITHLPSCFFQYFPGLQVFECPFGNLIELPENLKILCPNLTQLNLKGNSLKSIPHNLKSLVDLSTPNQAQKQTLVFEECIEQFSADQIRFIERQLNQLNSALEEGLPPPPEEKTSSPKAAFKSRSNKEIKKGIKSALKTIIENTSYLNLLHKQICYILYKDPHALDPIMAKIKEISKVYQDLQQGDFFGPGSKSLPEINEGYKSITRICSGIYTLQKQLRCCSDPHLHGDVMTIFKLFFKSDHRLSIPQFTGEIEKDGVIMASWLANHTNCLDEVSVLNIRDGSFQQCPAEFLKIYFKNLKTIQCTAAQKLIFSEFAQKQGLVIEVV